MSFDDLLARDAAVVTSRHMAENETVVYRAKDPALSRGTEYPTAYTIPAHVVREEPDTGGELSRARQHAAIVLVQNSADPTVGVANPSERGDKLDVVLRKGQPAVQCRVKSVSRGDAGLWRLEVVA